MYLLKKRDFKKNTNTNIFNGI